jgi:hypothetical protein
VFKYKLLLLSLGLSLALTPFGSVEAEPPTSSAVRTDNSREQKTSSDIGDPGINLLRLADGATAIEPRKNVSMALRNNALFITSDSRLIKIGDVYAKDKSIEQLTKMLPGPIDSTLKVTLIQGSQQITKSLTRYSPAKLYESLGPNGSLLNIGDLFTGWHGSNEDFASMGQNYHASGNNFEAAPYFIASVTCPKFIIPALNDDTTTGLPAAMDFFARTGMFDRFDAGVNKCIEISNITAKDWSESDAEMLAKCAAVLSQNGRPKEARSIYEKLYKLLPHLSMQNKIRVVMGQAAVIEQIEGSGAAFDNYKQVAEYCAQPGNLPRDYLLATLESLVAYSVKNKNLDMAEKAQLHIVELQRDKQGPFKHLQYQHLVTSLLKLSNVYELAGNFSKARDVLQEALSYYNDNLNTEEQILLERLGSPCPSEVELRLAYSYARNQQLDKALAQVDLAEKTVSEALGTDCDTIGEIKQIKNALLAQRDANDQAQLLKAFANLSEQQNTERPATTEIEDPGDAQLARQAYDAVAGHKTKASSLVDKLLQQELSKGTHTADDITRLINLIKDIEAPQNREKASTMLKQLDVCFNEPGAALSTNRVYQEAELALLTNAEPASGTAWENLEDALKEIEDARFRHHEKDAQRAVQLAFTRLLCVSYVYAFFDEPEKALSIVEYAKKQYPSVIEREFSPTAYEAILYLLENNMREAQKRIDILLSPTYEFRYDYSKMVITLSSTLFQTGHSDLSLKLLELDANSAMLNTRRALAYHRAIIDYKLGKYDDALSELGKEEDFILLPGHQIYNLRFLRAELLAKTGQKNEAILAYLKVAGTGRAQSQAFEKAVALARSMQTVPPSTTEMLAAVAQRLRAPDEQLIAAMKYVLTMAKKQNIASDKLYYLDSQLSYIEIEKGITDEVLANLQKRAQSQEDTRSPGASYEWANLARTCFRQQKYDEGTASMLHALRIYSGESFNHGIYHPGNLRGDLGFDLLVKAKRYDDAEKILKQCIEARKSPGWARTAYIEKSLLAELFIEEGKYDEASKWAEALLATLTADDGICPPKGGSMRAFLLFSIVDKFTAKGQYAIAQRLLDEATKVQLSVLGPRNALFIENYQAQAKLLEAQNKLPLAENFARKALDLENWVGGSGNAGRTSGVLLASILREEGKNAEADEMSVTHPKNANRSQDLGKLYNVRFFGSHQLLPERYADTAEEPLKQTLSETIETHGEGSADARKAMDDLTKFYVQQKRYVEAETLQLHELQMLDEQYGKCLEPKFGCFLNLAELYLLENKSVDASKFAQEITEPPPGDAVFDNSKPSLRLANVLFSVGKKDQALDLGRKVEKKLIESQGRFGIADYERRLDECLHFMERAGATEDANALRKLQDSANEQRHGRPGRATGQSLPPSKN